MTLNEWLVLTQNQGVMDPCFQGQKETPGITIHFQPMERLSFSFFLPAFDAAAAGEEKQINLPWRLGVLELPEAQAVGDPPEAAAVVEGGRGD